MLQAVHNSGSTARYKGYLIVVMYNINFSVLETRWHIIQSDERDAGGGGGVTHCEMKEKARSWLCVLERKVRIEEQHKARSKKRAREDRAAHHLGLF